MARPKLKEAKQQFTVMLKPSTVAEIDRLADKLDLSRSQLMANLVEAGLDDAKTLDKLRAYDLIKTGGKIFSEIRHGLLSGKFKVKKDGGIDLKE